MKKDPLIFIDYILECIELIEKYIKGKNKQDFLNSQLLQDGIIRRIEIIGEAVKNLPEEFKKLHESIPWKEIVGMRDIITHKYFGIDLELTWEVLDKELPFLKQDILKLKK